MEIGKKIRQLRDEAGMTQDELASKLFVTRTAVSKWETGKGWPGLDSLKLLADEFGCTIDSLVSDEDVQIKRAAEDKHSLRVYISAVICAAAAVIAALVGMSGAFDVSQTVVSICRMASIWGMIGYVFLSFEFSKASDRMSWKRVLISRIVVIVMVLVVVAGFVATVSTFG